MLEIREQILSVIKEKKLLDISDESSATFEIIEYIDDSFVYYGGDRKSNKAEFRYAMSQKQALSKICEYYRKKGNISAEPGYKQVYKYMTENN